MRRAGRARGSAAGRGSALRLRWTLGAAASAAAAWRVPKRGSLADGSGGRWRGCDMACRPGSCRVVVLQAVALQACIAEGQGKVHLRACLMS